MFEKLFEPVTINKMVVPNRLVFEPMGNYYAELNGDASQRDCDFYAARGAGGCGLVITEVCSVNRTTGRGDARNFHGIDFVASFLKFLGDGGDFGGCGNDRAVLVHIFCACIQRGHHHFVGIVVAFERNLANRLELPCA